MKKIAFILLIFSLTSFAKKTKEERRAQRAAKKKARCEKKQKRMPFLKWNPKSGRNGKCEVSDIIISEGKNKSSKKCSRLLKRYERKKGNTKIPKKLLLKLGKNECVKISIIKEEV